MKKAVHPEFYANAKVTCTACGTVFLIPGTVKDQQTEICSSCHPVYTGKHRGFTSSGRVERFQKKLAAAKSAPAKTPKKKLSAEEKLEKKLATKREEKKEKTKKTKK